MRAELSKNSDGSITLWIEGCGTELVAMSDYAKALGFVETGSGVSWTRTIAKEEAPK